MLAIGWRSHLGTFGCSNTLTWSHRAKSPCFREDKLHFGHSIRHYTRICMKCPWQRIFILWKSSTITGQTFHGQEHLTSSECISIFSDRKRVKTFFPNNWCYKSVEMVGVGLSQSQHFTFSRIGLAMQEVTVTEDSFNSFWMNSREVASGLI